MRSPLSGCAGQGHCPENGQRSNARPRAIVAGARGRQRRAGQSRQRSSAKTRVSCFRGPHGRKGKPRGSYHLETVGGCQSEILGVVSL